jgi:mannosyltransferase OCH1-like enzyme
MNLVDFIASSLRLFAVRVMQLCGNIAKFIFVLHSSCWPGARFTLPKVSLPILKVRGKKNIPRIVWTTNYTDRVTLPVYVNYFWNRMMSLSYEYRYCSDEECSDFIKSNFPTEVYDAFESLQIGAAKADLWRILVLQKIGGVYIDIDAAFCWPLEKMIGVEQSELFVRHKDGVFTNHFLAARPAHPLIEEMAARIVMNINANTLQSVFDMTGPTVVHEVAKGKSVYTEANRLVARQAMFTSKKYQYPDNLSGYWVKEQKEREIVIPKAPL